MNPLIIIVDDDPATVEFLEILVTDVLSKEADREIDLMSFDRGSLVLISTKSLAADRKVCLISDMSMPGMSGLELLVAMQEHLGARLVTKAIHSGEKPLAEAVKRHGATFILKARSGTNAAIKRVIRTFLKSLAE